MVRQVCFKICAFCGNHGDFILCTEPDFSERPRGPIVAYDDGLKKLHDLVRIGFFTTTEAAYLQRELKEANLPLAAIDLPLQFLLLTQNLLLLRVNNHSVPQCIHHLLN